MKISFNWLKEYVDVDLPAERVAELLTGCGLEVEGMELWSPVKGGLKGVVIGKVLTCEKHPDSDHLSLTTVDVGGDRPLPIVCGASNVAAGQKVVVATVGTTLYFNEKELVIQKAKIRGAVSEGMICAEDELGLGTSHAGIMVLDEQAVPGTPAAGYFGIKEDTVFEIGLTPNRADAASHMGVARDLTAVLNNYGCNEISETGRLMLKRPDLSGFKKDSDTRTILIDVLDPEACPRYSGLTISGITVGESPDWLKERLSSIGLRPINNIVDITNFVLFEMGQPLHAFDADKITGDRVVVKKYPSGTKFITLDGAERELSGDDLMICNTSEPMCIAGVFGGINSGVTSSTRSVFIESACFQPVSIRKTSKYHGLQTDASFRFERGTDPLITIPALKRAALLIKEIAGGEITSDIIDVYPVPVKENVVQLSYHHLDRLIGARLNRDVVENILKDLEIVKSSGSESGIELKVPPFKVDVTREADVIEEILRIYGYNNIELSEQVLSSLSYPVKPDPDEIRNMMSDFLSSNGFHEIMNNSLTRSSYYPSNTQYPAERAVRLVNPLSRDLDVLRQTLLFGGLETIVYNQNRKISDLKLFEFGTVYRLNLPGEPASDPVSGYHEEIRLALFITGKVFPESWYYPSRNGDFFELKSVLYGLLKSVRIEPEGLKADAYSDEYITGGMSLSRNDSPFVVCGMVHKKVLQSFDCRQPVFYADIHFGDLLAQLKDDAILFKTLPRFPEVRRDLALVIDKEVEFASIERIAFKTEKRLLKEVGLFDVYEGDKIEEGKKSYAVSFILRDDEKTLTDQEIDKVVSNLISAFEKQLNAKIRS